MNKKYSFILALALTCSVAMADNMIISEEPTAGIDADNPRIRALLAQAQNYLDKSDYVGAKKKLELVLQENPNHAKALSLMEICNREVEKQVARERVAYEDAVRNGSVESLRQFIARYPESDFVSKAQDRINDFVLWDNACKAGTINAFRNYLSTSTVKAYKAEAEKAINALEAKDDWERVKNSTSISEIERHINKYPNSPGIDEATFKLAVLKGEQAFANGNKSQALTFYEQARQKRSLTGDADTHYREILLDREFESLKNSKDATELGRFLNKVSRNSPYYNPISNQIARVKANALDGNSGELAYSEALSYSRDVSTRSYVEMKIEQAKKSHKRIRRQHLAWAHQEWWERNFKIGLHLVGFDVWKENESWRSGLRIKLGTHQDVFNIQTGADYVWQAFADNDKDYNGKSSRRYDPICHQIAVPLNIKFNFTNGDNKCSFYIGCAAEYAYTFATTSDYEGMTNDYTLAIEPQIGLNWKHADWGIYWRKYLDGYNILKKEYVEPLELDDMRAGMYLTIYF